MYPHEPGGPLVSWMTTALGPVAEGHRLRHLVALAERRAGEPALLDRALSRLGLRTADAPADAPADAAAPDPAPAPAPALDCCAVI